MTYGSMTTYGRSPMSELDSERAQRRRGARCTLETSWAAFDQRSYRHTAFQDSW